MALLGAFAGKFETLHPQVETLHPQVWSLYRGKDVSLPIKTPSPALPRFAGEGASVLPLAGWCVVQSLPGGDLSCAAIWKGNVPPLPAGAWVGDGRGGKGA